MPSVTRDTAGLGVAIARGFHPLWPAVPGGYSGYPHRYAVPRPRDHLHGTRFRLFRFRSPLLSESRLISFPVSTEMCHFLTFAELLSMDSREANPGCPGLGCPIRGSPDKLVCSTPGLIAAYHALHRLSAPRHPPYTLSNLSALIRISDRNFIGPIRFIGPMKKETDVRRHHGGANRADQGTNSRQPLHPTHSIGSITEGKRWASSQCTTPHRSASIFLSSVVKEQRLQLSEISLQKQIKLNADR